MTNSTNKCLNCAKEISLKAKYCSDKCRKAFSRSNPDKQVGQIQPGQPGQSTPDKQPGQKRELTLNEKSGLTERGKCHVCGLEVNHLICLCFNCVKEGKSHKELGIDSTKCN